MALQQNSNKRSSLIYTTTNAPTDGTSPKAIIYLLHGLGEHGGCYEELIEHLTTRIHCTVHTMDLRGHGRTCLGKRGDTGNLKTIFDDLEKNLFVLDKDSPLPKFIFGHSIGGLLMLHYALSKASNIAESFSGIILSAPAIQANHRPIALVYWLLTRIERWMPSFTIDTNVDPRVLSKDQEYLTRRAEDNLIHTRISLTTGKFLYELGDKMREQATKGQLPNLPIPLLIVLGSEDQLVNNEGTRLVFESLQGCPDKTLKDFEGYFHQPHHDLDRAQVIDLYVDWVQRHVQKK